MTANRSMSTNDANLFEDDLHALMLRSAAAQVESWPQPAQYVPMAPDADARVEYTPLGVVGVIGPWNFPIVCVFGPLAGGSDALSIAGPPAAGLPRTR
jgi:acyl-CoA reductase-like NAD-dependent aldehyde dehydrogenase